MPAADIRQGQGQAAPPHQTPDARLAELKKDFQDSQTQIDGLTKTRDALKVEIDTLGQVVDDTKKILAGYTSAYPVLDTDIKAIAAYDQSKMGFVGCKLSPARQEQIDDIVTGYDKEVDQQKQTAYRLAQEAAQKKSESDAARSDYQKAQDAYNVLKVLQKSLTDKDTAAKKLMADIDAHEGKKSYDAMYLQLRNNLEPMANDLCGALVPVETFKTELYDVVIRLDTAWETVREKKDAADAATAKVNDAKAKYDAMVANRTAELLKRVAALPPAPAPTAPAEPPATSA